MNYHLAVDIGASGGRHVVGFVEGGKLVTREVYRFENSPVPRGGHLCWDAEGLWRHLLRGLAACREQGIVPDTMAIDTWGVDFALLDAKGNLLGDIVAYRDGRTAGIPEEVEKCLPFAELYARTGIQKQPFNTIYQLAALRRQSAAALEAANALLLVPDWLGWRLTGEKRQEYTNATTTALVNATDKTWDMELIERLGFPGRLFGPLAMPGQPVGELAPNIQKEVGYTCHVLHAASHDTASAFLAMPVMGDNTACLSSGTWSLLGMETPEPILTAKARAANFTNEGGYGYRYRFLKNIMGLWIIQSVRRDYEKQYSYAQLEEMAREAGDFRARVDVNDSRFLAPRSMVEAVRQACRDGGQPEPKSPGEIAACIYQSLADGYAASIRELACITQKRIAALHIVGGGSRDATLNRLTAQACGLPVYAGPAEGTVVGNLLSQMIAAGTFQSLAQAREAVRESFPIEAYGEKQEEPQ